MGEWRRFARIRVLSAGSLAEVRRSPGPDATRPPAGTHIQRSCFDRTVSGSKTSGALPILRAVGEEVQAKEEEGEGGEHDRSHPQKPQHDQPERATPLIQSQPTFPCGHL